MFKRRSAGSIASEDSASPSSHTSQGSPQFNDAMARILEAMVLERSAALVAAVNEVSRQFGGFPPDAVQSSLEEALANRRIEANHDDIEIIANAVSRGMAKIQIEERFEVSHGTKPEPD
jgi:hypothetical protein